LINAGTSSWTVVRRTLEIHFQEADMDHDQQFRTRAHRARASGEETSDRRHRDERPEKNRRSRKLPGRIRGGNGDFEDDRQARSDAEDDIRGYCALDEEIERSN
jgi:hypothetical protein